MKYTETIEYLFGLQKQGIKFGLKNSRTLLALMGDPHRRFGSVHIAGTNGKGSTAAFVAAILQAAGYRVGLYTSPHLVSFTERIRVNGTQIAEERVVALAEKVRMRFDEHAGTDAAAPPTFFEVTTAMAFTYFAEERVDLAVVEVGMGGRLDSTNIITPLVSVITNVDLDHTEFLGGSIAEIAAEKAGIIKEQVPVVTGPLQEQAARVVQDRAERLCAPLYRMGAEFSPERIARGELQTFDYQGPGGAITGLEISLRGRHQVVNACLAVAAVERIRASGSAVPEQAVREGLRRATWDGRLERVAQRPDIYLDGAHNPAAAQVLAEELRDLRQRYRRTILIIGMLADKDAMGVLVRLLPHADAVIVTRPSYSRALDVERFAAMVRGSHPVVSEEGSVEAAVTAARRMAGADDLIVVSGSLYMVGDARAILAEGQQYGSALSGLTG